MENVNRALQGLSIKARKLMPLSTGSQYNTIADVVKISRITIGIFKTWSLNNFWKKIVVKYNFCYQCQSEKKG